MLAALLAGCSGASSVGGGAASVVEERGEDPHFPQPLITGLESKLDSTWEFPNDLRLVGTQELVQLGEGVQAATAAPPQRAGAPLECECERVKCNCVKRCDCALPSGASSLLQMQELLIPVGEPATPAMLELESSAAMGIVNQELACDCDRVKCNCIKHCECSVSGGMM